MRMDIIDKAVDGMLDAMESFNQPYPEIKRLHARLKAAHAITDSEWSIAIDTAHEMMRLSEDEGVAA